MCWPVAGEPVSPRLEDAYMSAVGGINQKPSPYGRISVGQAHDPAPRAKEAPEAPRIAACKLTKKFGSFTAAHEISFDVRAR